MRRRAEGDFLMLDNGACEGHLVSNEELMQTANTYMVNEIVVPDVLCDMEATLNLVKGFQDVALNSPEFNYMGVLQGLTMAELLECLRMYAQMSYISTIAIPRHVETTVGYGTRWRIVRHIREHYSFPQGPHYQIHLLGTNPAYINELIVHNRDYEDAGVRGVDTASPYYYAMNGKLIKDLEGCKRPDDYYNHKFTKSEHQLAKANTSEVSLWTRGS